MSRYYKKSEPALPRVEQVELSSEHKKARIITAVVLFVVGLVAIGIGLYAMLGNEKGWRTVDPGYIDGYTYVNDFKLNYYFGRDGGSAGGEYRMLVNAYNEVLTEATEMFNATERYDGVHNLCYINDHPNEEIEVDAYLYSSLKLLSEHSSKYMYLAPVYSSFYSIFACETDGQAAGYDPYYHEALASYFSDIASFASDESMIDLKFLGDNKVCLYVSDEYKKYSVLNDVTQYIDLWYIKNAFIVDYIADRLVERGYNYGYIVSYDGFTRCFDRSDTVYEYIITEHSDSVYGQAAVMEHSGCTTLVDLRLYPKSSLEDDLKYYRYSDGRIVSDRLDVSDGISRSSIDEITVYSYGGTCAAAVIDAFPIIISESFDSSAVKSLADNGVYAIYVDGENIVCTEQGLKLRNVTDGFNVKYD